jgi:cobalt transporter subunit CbtB (proposed)
MIRFTPLTVHGHSANLARLWPALSAALLGLVILYGAGFAPQAAVHNGAHDARHSAAFPCH